MPARKAPVNFEPRERIDGGMAFSMLGTAALFDFLKATLTIPPVVGNILEFFIVGVSFGTFFIWYKSIGINFSDRIERYVMSTAVVIGLEVFDQLLPVHMIPDITLGVWMMIETVRGADRAYNEQQAKKAGQA